MPGFEALKSELGSGAACVSHLLLGGGSSRLGEAGWAEKGAFSSAPRHGRPGPGAGVGKPRLGEHPGPRLLGAGCGGRRGPSLGPASGIQRGQAWE